MVLMHPATPWRSILATVVVVLALAILGGLAFIYSGSFDVSATKPHWPVTRWLMETARDRSIEAHAAGIEAPAGLGDEAKVVKGTEHFAAHCAVCHGAPGVPRGDIGQGLYPRPPDLAHVAGHFSESELFWIIRHGIKMSGMPSWTGHSDEEIWAIVAFLKTLPGMTEQEYGRLIREGMAPGGQHHDHAAPKL